MLSTVKEGNQRKKFFKIILSRTKIVRKQKTYKKMNRNNKFKRKKFQKLKSNQPEL